MNNVPCQVTQLLVFALYGEHALELLLWVNPLVEVRLDAKAVSFPLQSLCHDALKQTSVPHDNAQALPQKIDSVLSLTGVHRGERSVAWAAKFAQNVNETDTFWSQEGVWFLVLLVLSLFRFLLPHYYVLEGVLACHARVSLVPLGLLKNLSHHVVVDLVRFDTRVCLVNVVVPNSHSFEHVLANESHALRFC